MADPTKNFDPLPNEAGVTWTLNLPAGTTYIPRPGADGSKFLNDHGQWAVPAGSAGGVLMATLDLNRSDILGINLTPVTMVPAVAGAVLIPLAFTICFKFNTTNFIDLYGLNQINCYLGADRSTSAIQAPVFYGAGFLDQTADQFVNQYSNTSLVLGPADTLAVNQPLVLQAQNDPGLGDGTGPVSGVTVTFPGTQGSGYAINDTFTIDGLPGAGATGHVTAVDEFGGVTGVALDLTGLGYTPQEDVNTTTTSGGGSGLVVDITTTADCPVRVTCWYTLTTFPPI